MAKKISVARVLHFPKTADCKKLTKAQLEALQTLSCKYGPRAERLISTLPYQYQTLEALVARRMAKFRSINIGTNRFMYVCITGLGQQITNLHERQVDEGIVLENIYRNAEHLLSTMKSGMRHLGVPIPKKRER